MESPTLNSGPVAPPVGAEDVTLKALRDEDERPRLVWPPNPGEPDIPRRVR
jgi:hypothetical protein